MELTASAFNVLLNMTTISEVAPLSTSTSKPSSRDKKATQASKATKPVIHYSDGQSSKTVSHEELLQIISNAPQAKHLIWTKGYKAWRSWKDIKSLKQAVKNNLQLRKTHTQLSQQELQTSKKAVARKEVSSQNSIPKRSPAQSSQKQATKPEQVQHFSQQANSTPQQARTKPPKAKHSFNYLSVPATVFTKFDVELSSTKSALPYVGLDHSLQSGGLFLPTSRVLNIGDYLQITVRIHEKTLLKFEAPVLWLRAHQDDINLQNGVAVAWPTLTAEQLSLIQKVTSSESYEFFVA